MQIYRFTSHVFSSNGASVSAHNNQTIGMIYFPFIESNAWIVCSLHFNFPQCDVLYLYRYGRWIVEYTVYMSYTRIPILIKSEIIPFHLVWVNVIWIMLLVRVTLF